VLTEDPREKDDFLYQFLVVHLAFCWMLSQYHPAITARDAKA
jgi:hypothetical protein